MLNNNKLFKLHAFNKQVNLITLGRDHSRKCYDGERKNNIFLFFYNRFFFTIGFSLLCLLESLYIISQRCNKKNKVIFKLCFPAVKIIQRNLYNKIHHLHKSKLLIM